MRRSKDDKRVLRSGNGRQNNSRRQKRNPSQLFSRQKRNNLPVNPRSPRAPRVPRNRRNSKKQRKSNGKLVFIMIVALVAFVIGAGIGVSLTFDDNNVDEGPKYENVTKEMTSNLTNVSDVYFDKTADGVDYNANNTSDLETQYTDTSQ